MRKEKHIPPAVGVQVNAEGDKMWYAIMANGGHDAHRKEGPSCTWAVTNWEDDYCGFSCNVCYPPDNYN